MRIIYVEDNIANVHLVKRVARMGKHEVINYIDGMDALNNFESDKPDLVLMDIQLAGELTGIEVVEKLREKGFKTPIFAVTAYAMVGDKERCIEAGCTGYMSKPIPVPELVKLFEKFADIAAQAKTSAETKVDVPSDKVNNQPTVESTSSAPTATNEKPAAKQDEPTTESIQPKISEDQDKQTTEPTPTSATIVDENSEQSDTVLKTQTSKLIPQTNTLAEGDDKVSDSSSTPVAKSDVSTTTSQPADEDRQAKIQ